MGKFSRQLFLYRFTDLSNTGLIIIHCSAKKFQELDCQFAIELASLLTVLKRSFLRKNIWPNLRLDAKNVRYLVITKSSVSGHFAKVSAGFGRFFVIIRPISINKFLAFLAKNPAIFPKVWCLLELQLNNRHFWTLTKGPARPKVRHFGLAVGPAPARGQNLTFVLKLTTKKKTLFFCFFLAREATHYALVRR